ncbi:MAG: response regulator transcription factor, partial [Hyphomicrobiaceae bacterium]|nr:response regulator transcription factor [Hyphomicrobiaceae bacterium]
AGALLPIIIITGHGDVPLAVRAMKAGAVEFLQKPFNDQVLLDTVQSALATYDAVWNNVERRNRYSESLSSLTKREKEVLELLRKGKPNKVVASLLDISVRTVEGHRASIMAKTGTTSLGQLIDMLYSNE